MQRIQQKQNDPTILYNLFCQQPAVFTKTVKSPKPEKTQLKIVFQHPNLLYLSDKRVKSKQEISEEVEKRLLQMIKNQMENQIKFKKDGRPASSYFNCGQNQTDYDKKVEPFRCMTSVGSSRARKRQKFDLKERIEKLSSEPKLNMYIEMQRRIFNYNNRTRKSNIKKQIYKTQQCS